MSSKYSYTPEQLIEAIKTSFSIAEVLRKLNLNQQGSSYKSIKKHIKKNNIDISHFKGKGWSKNKSFQPKRDISAYLSNQFQISSHNLKKRLLKEKIFTHTCSSCHLTEWMNNPIPLELDHIDGNHENNNLLNLRLLCPNCHAFTPTYRGKNKKENKQLLYESNNCLECSRKISSNRKVCGICYNLFRSKYQDKSHFKTKIDWASNEELLQMLSESNYTQVAKKLGVSDNAIRKRIKNHKS